MSKLVVTTIEDSSGDNPLSKLIGSPVDISAVSTYTFTGIPAGVTRVTVATVTDMSTTTTADPYMQIGDAGGLESSGYTSGLTTGTTGASTSGSWKILDNPTAVGTYSFIMMMMLTDKANNTWTMLTISGRTDGGQSSFGSGTKSLSDTLTQLKFETGGSFDDGEINLRYEY